ncbi:MAG: sensor histidine kinase KdpD [Pirellula sp.]|nr:sensor histidine kinase KdpD [Pirellula sp.]
MNESRPNPDQLLARVQHEETRARRGKLRIFFGYAAGVGKTYAMLSAAQRERKEGVDVVVGYVEPHGRADTEALLAGLEALPFQFVPYRGVELREFNLDAALARHPSLLLVDELAHTNAEGLRHAKRWQDVFELLDAGIDVWTTLNVQHIESLNDVISEITGVVVRETLPDAVLEQADEIELIDLTPAELVERLQEGKIYLPSQVERALKSFFQKGNLTALRELSLRQAAQRLHQDVEAARTAQSAAAPWLTTERLLVCVGPSPTSARILRTAKRLAASIGAEWIAVAVNTGGGTGAVEEATGRNLRLAEKLGAETHTLIGRNVAETLIDFARQRNVSKIVVGKTAQVWWKRRIYGTIVDELIKRCGQIDVYVVSGDGEEVALPPRTQAKSPTPWREYLLAGAIVAVCTGLGYLAHFFGLAETNIVMFFLAGVALASTRLSRGPSIAMTVVSVLVFDFCFVPPHYTFAIGDSEYLITFAVMLGIGLLIGGLTTRQRSQLSASQQQERRTGQLFRMTRQLSELSGTEFLVRTAGRQLDEIFDGETVLFVRESDGKLSLRYGESSSIAAASINQDVARWVADNGKLAGAGTDTLPSATATFVPLVGSQHTVGAVGVRPLEQNRFLDPEQQRLLETCASLLALSLERDESVLNAQQSQIQVETEKLRNSLLSAVSHDIRTPLAGIAGASSTLAASFDSLDAATRGDLLKTISEEAEALSRVVDNLLHMTRLSSGKVAIDRQWHFLEEVVGSALTRMERQLVGRTIETRLDATLPMVHIDASLIEQLLMNLIDNAAKYSPHGSAIEVSGRVNGDGVELEVADRGRGFMEGDEAKVFDLFYRGNGAKPDRRGTGIGLAICRAVVDVHGGRIEARNRPGGGAIVRVTLPGGGAPPAVVDRSGDAVAV